MEKTIFSSGEIGELMYGIIEGEIEMFVDGKTVEILKAGDIFGAGELIHPDHARDSTAVAKMNCKLAYIDLHRFLFAVENSPVFAIEVMRSYSDRLRRLKHML